MLFVKENFVGKIFERTKAHVLAYGFKYGFKYCYVTLTI